MTLGLGEKPQAVGRHHWVQGEALGRSWPKRTASQALPHNKPESLLIRRVYKGQQLREQA